MIVGIDASRAVKPNRTGPENYSFDLIRHMIALDKKNKYILYAPHLPSDDWPSAENVRWEIVQGRRLWSQIHLAKHLRVRPPDVLFIPSHVVPLLSKLPTVVTIHDLAYKYFPSSYRPFERRYLDLTTAVSATKAKMIITPSKATKQDLVREYRVEPDKITVIPHSYNEEVFNSRRKLPEPPIRGAYFIYVGRIEEKKNLKLLIDAFAIVARERNPVSLVLSGKNGYGFELIQRRIRQLPPKIANQIIQPGFLPQYDLLRYLKHATGFVFPSWYEGFGLAVLEAMAMGLPVICSNTSSLPEVTADAAVLLAPKNPLSWAGAMSRVLNQPNYAKALREKSLKRAEAFSWDRSAKTTLEVISHAFKTSSS